MLQKPLVPTARTSADCGQTWRRRTTNGCAAFGIIKRLCQVSCFTKQGATLAKCMLYYQKIFMIKKMPSNLCRIFRLSGNFLPRNLPFFPKKFPITIAMTQSVNYFTVRSNHSTSPVLNKTYNDRMILRHTIFTKLACLFHVIVNISFSYDVLLITTAW